MANFNGFTTTSIGQAFNRNGRDPVASSGAGAPLASHEAPSPASPGAVVGRVQPIDISEDSLLFSMDVDPHSTHDVLSRWAPQQASATSFEALDPIRLGSVPIPFRPRYMNCRYCGELIQVDWEGCHLNVCPEATRMRGANWGASTSVGLPVRNPTINGAPRWYFAQHEPERAPSPSDLHASRSWDQASTQPIPVSVPMSHHRSWTDEGTHQQP